MIERPETRCFVIAEAGVNHNGDVSKALELVDIAAEAGADAVKFQTFSADRLVTPSARKATYQTRNQPGDDRQHAMLKALELDHEAHRRLAERAADRGIEFMSTPFDVESLRFLADSVRVSRIKLGSGEINNLPLLYEAGRSGLPLILSTGMADLEEISASLGAIYCGALGIERPRPADLHAAHRDPRSGEVRQRVWLLQCTTDYPARPEDINLRVIPALRERFEVPVGFSDHTTGDVAALGAVALGAVAVEKHYTLSRDLPGPDHKASLEPAELTAFVARLRELETCLGTSEKRPTERELGNVAAARKSLFAARPIAAGAAIATEDLASLRPGGGLSPVRFWDVAGRPAGRDYAAFDPIDSAEAG